MIQVLELPFLFMVSSVAAAECPMIYSTKGEKGEEFKVFEAESFVRQLMRKQIISWLSLLCFVSTSHLMIWYPSAANQDHEREDKTPEFAYTLRKMHAYFSKACQGKVVFILKPLLLFVLFCYREWKTL